MWLRDVLPLNFPSFRILTWGYDSGLQDSRTTQSIMDFSSSLLLALDTVRGESENRPIVLIGHSLGGLVIKRALVHAAQRKSDKDISLLQACVGLFLFGVPSGGLKSESLLSLVKGKRNALFVASLEEGSELLRTLHNDFMWSYGNGLKPCFIAAFFETKDTKTVLVDISLSVSI